VTDFYFSKNEHICTVILAGVVAAYEATSYELPERKVLGYIGMPIDCEMLAVSMTRMYQVDQTQGPHAEAVAAQRCVSWAGTDVDVLLARCTPQPTASSVAGELRAVPKSRLEAFSKMQMADPLIITRGVIDTWKAELLGLGANIAFVDYSNIQIDEGGLVVNVARLRVGNLF
jgi:hypothetical protein